MAKVFVPRDALAVALNADAVARAIAKGAAARSEAVTVVRTGSRGLSWLEPMVEVETPEGRVAYGPVTEGDVEGLVDAGLLTAGEHPLRLGRPEAMDYLAKQQRLTFSRCGLVDPVSLDDYRAHGGLKGLEAALKLDGTGIVDTVKASGLRGRGGAGFPTGIKWNTVMLAESEQKYVVCNADEGDSGTFADRMLTEGDPAQSDPDTQHVTAGLAAMECVVVQDIFLNETAKYAHVFLPGSSFLEKDGTFTNAERRISRVRKVMPPLGGHADWEVTVMLSNALGYPMTYGHPSEIARLIPTFSGVSYAKLDAMGSIQWPCNDAAPLGTPMMHVDRFVRGLGRFMITEFVATEERTGPRFPLILTTGRILSQYNVGAQTRRTDNSRWHEEDVLEIHPFDAESRGIVDGDLVALVSRSGDIALKARVSERMQPGVVCTTFHHAKTGANVITTDYSDWATNCPEYKVTAVQVRRTNRPSDWQARFYEDNVALKRIEARQAAE